MIPNFMNEPVTRYELRMLVETISNLDNMYIPEKDYIKQIGISESRFYCLRKEGRFENGYHPATRGCRKRLIHRFFNMHSGRIEIPCLNYTEQIIVPMRKPRDVSGKNTIKISGITIENIVKATYEPSEPNVSPQKEFDFQHLIEIWRWRSANTASC